jgi:hypothetical protein
VRSIVGSKSSYLRTSVALAPAILDTQGRYDAAISSPSEEIATLNKFHGLVLYTKA